MELGSLFSGAGLGDLGWMMAGFEIQWQVEIDKYCQKVLDLRFPESEKYYDIKKFKPKEAKPVDIVAGGFPCQPFSVAGKQKGDQDDRNLWPEMFRIIKKIRPSWVVCENVSGIINIYLDIVLDDLESEGYATRTFVFPAHALGASHRRERIWIVGYYDNAGSGTSECEANGNGEKEIKDNREQPRVRVSGSSKKSENVANPKKQFSNVSNNKSKRKISELRDSCSEIRRYWEAEPRICRVVDGCSDRVDRLKALGNGQVMACTAFIGQQIMEFERIIA